MKRLERGSTALVTGASSGIGRAVAHELARRGVEVLAVGRDAGRTRRTVDECRALGTVAHPLLVDLAEDGAADELVVRVRERFPRLTDVFHVAGVGGFHPVESDTEEGLTRMWAVNVRAPMLLTRGLLPVLRRNEPSAVVFVGSIFGSLAFPWFAAYSATKHAVRGYADALRRELDGAGPDVVYVAPRGTRTAMSANYAEMAAEVGMTLDPPGEVAEAVVSAAASGRTHTYLGGQERMGVRIGAVAPRLMDRLLASQTRAMATHAREEARTLPRTPSPRASAEVLS